MRVPRALEFPAVILVTGVLTFTGVSALQASVNAPLAKMAEARTAKGPIEPITVEPIANPKVGTDLRAVLAAAPAATPPELLTAPAADAHEHTAHTAVSASSTELASTAAVPEGVFTSAQPPAAAAAAAAAQVSARVPVAAPVAPAAAAHAPAQAAVAQRPAVTPAPAAPVAPAPKPSPVSGMDYVWDQVFGDGSYGKPGTPAGSNNGNGKTGVGQVCPPGQAKKGNC